MTRAVAWLSLFGLLLWCSGPVYAAQTDFQRIQQADQWLLSYTWQDKNDQEYAFHVSLPQQGLAQQRRMIRGYQPQQLSAVQTRALRLAERDLPGKVSVQLLPSSSGQVQWQVTGPQELLATAQQTLQKAVAEATSQFYHQRYLRRGQDNFGAPALLIDYPRVLDDSQALLEPVIHHFKEQLGTNPRLTADFINQVLSWVQTIPYKTLDAVDRSDDFLAPGYLMYRNEGDCDAKTVLAATILKGAFPDLKLAIVILPQHALLGLVTKDRNLTGRQTMIRDQTFLLAETAGPAILPLGEVADNTERLLKQGIARAIWLN